MNYARIHVVSFEYISKFMVHFAFIHHLSTLKHKIFFLKIILHFMVPFLLFLNNRFIDVTTSFLQVARRRFSSIMDDTTSIRYGGMIFCLAAHILDTGQYYYLYHFLSIVHTCNQACNYMKHDMLLYSFLMVHCMTC